MVVNGIPPGSAALSALSPEGNRTCCSPSTDPGGVRRLAVPAAQPPPLCIRYATPPCMLRVVSIGQVSGGSSSQGTYQPSCSLQTPFQEPPPLQGLPRALESLPPPVALFGAALLVALSGAGGALLGNQLPGAGTAYVAAQLRRHTHRVFPEYAVPPWFMWLVQRMPWSIAAGMRLAGRVVGGLVGLAVGKIIVDKLKEQRAAAAVNELYRLLAAKSDPGSLTAKEVRRVWMALSLVLRRWSAPR